MSLEVTVDLPSARKARGAFFTPAELCDYVAAWAIRSDADVVLEPSCGEAAFLLSAGARLQRLSGARPVPGAQLRGVEVHGASATAAKTILTEGSHRYDELCHMLGATARLHQNHPCRTSRIRIRHG